MAWATYTGIAISEKLLIITGGIEIVIMVALAITGFLDPGPGGFSFAPLNPANAPAGSGLFTAIVFSIFAFSGWEAVAPLAEESKNPRRNVPIGLIASVVILTVYFVIAVWGYLVGIGVDNVAGIPDAEAFPVFTLATDLWGGAWVLVLFALLNSVFAVSIACFNGGTRTWYAMGRSGTPAEVVLQGRQQAQDTRQRHPLRGRRAGAVLRPDPDLRVRRTSSSPGP